MTQEDVIEEIKLSGLAGRGGAGFPTWFKWNAAKESKADKNTLFVMLTRVTQVHLWIGQLLRRPT